MKQVIETVGPYAGLLAMLGFLVVSMLLFSQARDLRRLREWAGGAPERDAEIREVSEVVAEQKSQELKVLAEREERRMEREGLVAPCFLGPARPWWPDHGDRCCRAGAGSRSGLRRKHSARRG